MADSLTIRRVSASPDAFIPISALRSGGPTYAKLVDIGACIGCKGCEVACKEWNDLGVEPTANFGSYQSHRDLSPKTWLLMRFNEVEVDGQLNWLIKKDACLHCEEPGCLFSCPARAPSCSTPTASSTSTRRTASAASTASPAARSTSQRFDVATRKVSKCNMCVDRVEAGLEPACVKTCPTNAISWGSKHDMLALADKKVETLKSRGYENAAVYNPAGVGGTHMMYVVPHGDRLADYSLPSDPTASPAPMTGLVFLKRIGAWLMGFGVLGALVHFLRYGPERLDEHDDAEQRPA